MKYKVLVILLAVLMIIPVYAKADTLNLHNSISPSDFPSVYDIQRIDMIDVNLNTNEDLIIEYTINTSTLEKILIWDGYHIIYANWYRSTGFDHHIYITFKFDDIIKLDRLFGLPLIFISFRDH